MAFLSFKAAQRIKLPLAVRNRNVREYMLCNIRLSDLQPDKNHRPGL